MKSAWSTVGHTLLPVAWLSLSFCSHTSTIYFRLLNISHFRRKWASMWQFLFSQDECLFFINARICRLASLLSIWLFNRLIRRIGSVLRPSRSLNGVSIRPVGGGLISSCQTKTWDDGRDTERKRDTERAREREKWRERDDLFWSSASKPVYRSIVAVNYMLQMFYSLAISVSNLHAMYQPVASIPTNGTVPTKPAGKKKNIKIYTATLLTQQNTSRHIILP